MTADGRFRLTSPPTFHIPDLSAAVVGITAGPVEEHRIEATYFDTADLRLARSGAVLIDGHGDGWVLQLPSAKGAARTHELRFEGKAGAVPAEALRLVAAFRLGGDLRPVARLSTLRRRVVLRDESGAQVLEVSDDEVSVFEGRRLAARYRQLAAVPETAAADGLVEAVRERLLAAGAGEYEPAPDLVQALGPGAQRPADFSPAPLAPDATVGEAARSALAQPAEALLRNDWALRRGDEPDAVRRVRVATRRLRPRLPTFSDFLDAEWSTQLGEELAWLGDALAAVRDPDVRAARIRAHAPNLDPPDRRFAFELADQAAASAAAARERLNELLDGPRYLALLEKVADAAKAPALRGNHDRRAAEVLAGMAQAPWSRLRRRVRSLTEHPSEAGLHEVRIRAKQARYAAEAAVPFAPAATPFVTALEAVQRALGEHHDAAEARAWLREAARTGRRAFVAGELHAFEGDVAERALDDFWEAWRAAKRPRLRKWME